MDVSVREILELKNVFRPGPTHKQADNRPSIYKLQKTSLLAENLHA